MKTYRVTVHYIQEFVVSVDAEDELRARDAAIEKVDRMFDEPHYTGWEAVHVEAIT